MACKCSIFEWIHRALAGNLGDNEEPPWGMRLIMKAPIERWERCRMPAVSSPFQLIAIVMQIGFTNWAKGNIAQFNLWIHICCSNGLYENPISIHNMNSTLPKPEARSRRINQRHPSTTSGQSHAWSCSIGNECETVFGDFYVVSLSF